MRATGESRLFVFLDSMRERVDTLGGRRHPTVHRRLVDLTGERRPPARPGRSAGIRWARS